MCGATSKITINKRGWIHGSDMNVNYIFRKHLYLLQSCRALWTTSRVSYTAKQTLRRNYCPPRSLRAFFRKQTNESHHRARSLDQPVYVPSGFPIILFDVLVDTSRIQMRLSCKIIILMRFNIPKYCPPVTFVCGRH